jgi:hypothetical protein
LLGLNLLGKTFSKNSFGVLASISTSSSTLFSAILLCSVF